MGLTQRCSPCGEVKPLSGFNKNKSRPNGHHNHCRECHRGYARKRARRDPAEARDRMLRWKYGITAADWEALLDAQGGRCAICRTDQPQPTGNAKNGAFHVDHCHATGKVRGLLCRNCNTALGLVSESPEVLATAIAYLERHAPCPL